jgi:hypothetical protein
MFCIPLTRPSLPRNLTMRTLSSLVLASFGILLSAPAWDHGVAGPRVFTNTIMIDNPAAADGTAFPAFTWQHADAGDTGRARNTFDFNFKFNKRITDNPGVGINDGYAAIQRLGSTALGGWRNLSLPLKHQVYTNAEHELLASLGVIRTFAGTGTDNIDNDAVGLTKPTFYFGNSFPYPGAQVKDFGLPPFINKLTSLIEVAWSSPASKPPVIGTQHLFATGVAYGGAGYGLTAEAVIPGNRQTGTNVGFIARLHPYFEDLTPNSLSKSPQEW